MEQKDIRMAPLELPCGSSGRVTRRLRPEVRPCPEKCRLRMKRLCSWLRDRCPRPAREHVPRPGRFREASCSPALSRLPRLLCLACLAEPSGLPPGLPNPPDRTPRRDRSLPPGEGVGAFHPTGPRRRQSLSIWNRADQVVRCCFPAADATIRQTSGGSSFRPRPTARSTPRLARPRRRRPTTRGA